MNPARFVVVPVLAALLLGAAVPPDSALRRYTVLDARTGTSNITFAVTGGRAFVLSEMGCRDGGELWKRAFSLSPFSDATPLDVDAVGCDEVAPCREAKLVQNHYLPQGSGRLELSCEPSARPSLILDRAASGERTYFFHYGESDSNRLYQPGCKNLVDALGLDLAAAEPTEGWGELFPEIVPIPCQLEATPLPAPDAEPTLPATMLSWCQGYDQRSIPASTRDTVAALRAYAENQLGAAPADCAQIATKLGGLGGRTLNLARTAIVDARPIASLTHLEGLDLTETRLADPTPLGALTSLRRLDLSRTSVSSLASLAPLRELEEIAIAHTPVRSLLGLEGAHFLSAVDAEDAALEDVSALKDKVFLVSAKLAGNRLGVELDLLDTLARAQEFDLGRNVPGLTDADLKALVTGRRFSRWCLLRPALPAPEQRIVAHLTAIAATPTCFAAEATLGNLSSIDLSGQSLSDAAALAAAAIVAPEKTLDLSRNPIAQVETLRRLLDRRGTTTLLGIDAYRQLRARISGTDSGVCWLDASSLLHCRRAAASDFPWAEPPTNLSAKAVSAGNVFSCAQTTDDLRICWGRASHPVTATLLGKGGGRVGQCYLGATGTPVCDSRSADWLDSSSQLPGRIVELADGDRVACGIDGDTERVTCNGYYDGRVRGAEALADLPAFGLTLGSISGCIFDRFGVTRCWSAAANAPQTLVPPDLRAVDVVAGLAETCALTQDHRVQCWGSTQIPPVALPGLARPVALALTGTDRELCALDNNNDIRCFQLSELR